MQRSHQSILSGSKTFLREKVQQGFPRLFSSQIWFYGGLGRGWDDAFRHMNPAMHKPHCVSHCKVSSESVHGIKKGWGRGGLKFVFVTSLHNMGNAKCRLPACSSHWFHRGVLGAQSLLTEYHTVLSPNPPDGNSAALDFPACEENPHLQSSACRADQENAKPRFTDWGECWRFNIFSVNN